MVLISGSEGLNGASRFLLPIRFLALSDDDTLRLEHELLSLELLQRRFLLFLCLRLVFFFLALPFLLMLDETLEELDDTFATATQGRDPDADNASTVEDEESRSEFRRCITSAAEGASPLELSCAFAATCFFGSGFEGGVLPEDERTTAGDDWAARGAPSTPEGTTAGGD